MTKTKKKPSKKTVKPGKDIVASMVEDFRKKILESIKNGIKDLTVNFTGVKMVDSVGIGLLIAAHNSLNQLGGKLTVKNVSEDLYGLFQSVRLDQHFEVKQTK
jgi:anti-anti-sigma factor